ncbi:MAG: DegT/DnrJ/EryC1/StrS family aminotransferase [Kiritimatiellae bacterium]|nr:DegT/DnrJ/EryC1/StrS family aminotransferase [Kiritimatiellia bacterium]
MSKIVSEKMTPAILGGKPIRKKPFSVTWPVIGLEERRNLLKVFGSGKWWYGEKVAEFEKKYAAFQNAGYGVSCTNGTAALEIALLACGIGAGDEVIVPPYTFMATASAVLKVNAVPVFADIDLNTGNLDQKAAEKAITSKTRAIMPVHMAGLPVDMDAFKALARKHKLRLIEDACHSWGSQWKGKGTGAIGDCGVFSFQMSKNITAGEGGILLTDNEEIADAARSYTNCGRGKGKAWYEHYLLGSNLRMTELQSAILLGQLTRLKAQTLRRERNAAIITRGLKGIPGVALMQRDRRVTRRSYHMYMFRFVTEAWPGVSRETFLKALNAEGIPASAGYPIPLYMNPLFQRKGNGPRHCPLSCPYYGKTMDYTRVSCPNTEQVCREACWIRHSVLLNESGDMRDIVEAITKLWEQRESLRHV